MNKINCTVYDCEFAVYHNGVIIENVVYILDADGKPNLAREYICNYVDFGLVQFYVGDYDESDINYSKNTSKWGYFEFSTGKVAVPPMYNYGGPFYGERACVIKNMKFGFINQYGEVVVDFIWDGLGRSFPRNLYCVKSGLMFGYIDKNGIVVLQPQFEMTGDFKFIGSGCDEYQYAAMVKKDGKYGFIHEKGKYIIEPKFEEAKAFCKTGYALVMKDKKWWVISCEGELIIDSQFDEVKEGGIGEKGDYYIVKRNNQWGIVDSEYKFIIPDDGSSFVVCKDRKIYIKDGKIESIKKIKN